MQCPNCQANIELNPGNLTRREAKFAANMVNPKIETNTEAARLAGYKSPRVQASQKLAQPKLQLAIARKQERQQDRALAIKRKSAAAVLTEVSKSDADPGFALQAFAVSSKVLESTGEVDEPVTEQEHQHLTLKLRRRFLRGLLCGLYHPTRAVALAQRLMMLTGVTSRDLNQSIEVETVDVGE